MNNKSRVCVVDDDASFLENTARSIRAGGYAVETCASGKEFLQCLDLATAFCVVFEINTPDLHGLELLGKPSFTKSGLPIIFTAQRPTVATCVQAMKAGAVDFLTKPFDEARLLAAIKEAARRRQTAQEAAFAFEQFNSLTQREQEVFGLVTTGLLNKQIAAELGIAEKTVKVHRGRMMEKMEVQSVAELVRLSEKMSSMMPLDKTKVPLRSGSSGILFTDQKRERV